MKIFLGTKSEQKITIVKEYFDNILKYELIACDARSDITDQPLDLETTKQGAINRAKNIIQSINLTNIDEYLLIGLEGGLVMCNGLYNLVCVTAIIDHNNEIFIGTSDYLPLPEEVSNRIIVGEQFGEVIRDFKNNMGGHSKVKTNQTLDELINRKKSFLCAIDRAYKK